MKHTIIFTSALLLGLSSAVSAQGTKVGIINIQSAILSTKDGQKAVTELQTKIEPTRTRLAKQQADLDADKAKLSQGSNAMSVEQRDKLMRDIDQKTKSLNRATEDAQAELEQEQGKIMQELGQRIMAVVNKYSKDNGYALIMDVSSQQTPVLVAINEINITGDIVKLYDQNAPGAASPASAPAPRAPAPKKAPPAAK